MASLGGAGFKLFRIVIWRGLKGPDRRRRPSQAFERMLCRTGLPTIDPIGRVEFFGTGRGSA